jgi:ABC-2 type transport system ATP-binding protein
VTTPPAVEVDGLVVRHGDLVAVDGISFTAASGEVLALLGPNGAGKTTTVEVLEGYQRPAAGTARVLGHDPVIERARVVDRIGVMLQDGGVHPGIRPPEVLRLLAALYDDPLDPDDLLARVGLDDRRRQTWRQLSGGEQQRLSLAMALIGRPEVAFLDEPTAGVDVRGRQVIRSIVRDLAAGGCAVVLCTHELDEAEKLADRVVIVDRGKVVGSGTLDELRSQTSGEVRFSAAPELDVDALGEHLDAVITEPTPGEYVIGARPGHQLDNQLAARLTGWLANHDIALGDLRAGRQRLEDVFLLLTAEDDEADVRRAVQAGRRRRGRRRGRRTPGSGS